MTVYGKGEETVFNRSIIIGVSPLSLDRPPSHHPPCPDRCWREVAVVAVVPPSDWMIALGGQCLNRRAAQSELLTSKT